ncbi:MAG: phage terminase large subunit, partial [Minisyncoccia bacterium]
MLELSEKQLISYREATARLNIWIGSVRSGKSFAANYAFLKFIRSDSPGDMIILGKSATSVKRNIVKPLLDLLGTRIQYFSGKQELYIGNRTIYIVGANDERAEAKIRGCTLLGALVDEITILPQSVWNMLLTRLSLPGARLFGTSNPDSPYHWLKTDFLDKKDGLDLRSWDFDFNDNPSLSKEYVENLKKEFHGLWYQRYIDAKWVLAEGAIYDFFDSVTHVIESPPSLADYYICGIDYGTTNPCVFSLI